MRTKHTFRLPPDLAGQLADYAGRKRVPQALVVETALSSYLSPDNCERSSGVVRALLAHGHAATAGHRTTGRPGQGARALRRICRSARPAVGEGTDPGPGGFSGGDFQGEGAGSYGWLLMNGFAVVRSF